MSKEVQRAVMASLISCCGAEGGKLREQKRKNFEIDIDEDGERFIHFTENDSTKNTIKIQSVFLVDEIF